MSNSSIGTTYTGLLGVNNLKFGFGILLILTILSDE